MNPFGMTDEQIDDAYAEYCKTKGEENALLFPAWFRELRELEQATNQGRPTRELSEKLGV